MSETPNTERHHAQEPAEGGTDVPAEFLNERQHSEEPAEGADADEAAPRRPADGGTAAPGSQGPTSGPREDS